MLTEIQIWVPGLMWQALYQLGYWLGPPHLVPPCPRLFFFSVVLEIELKAPGILGKLSIMEVHLQPLFCFVLFVCLGYYSVA